MRVALIIAGRILRQRLRDRSAIVFAVLTPLGLALVFAAVIHDFSPDFHTTIAVVDEDRGPVSQALISGPLQGLVGDGIADIKVLSTEVEADASVRAAESGAAVIIPAGFSAAVHAAAPTEIRILAGSDLVAREVARAAVSSFTVAVGTNQLTVATIGAVGGTVDAATAERIRAAVSGSPPIVAADGSAIGRQATLPTFYAAAMAIMFVFFATQYGALAILSERRVGTLNRLLAAPIGGGSVILGGSIAGFALGLLAMSVLVVVTTVVAHARWGPPPLVALLIGAAVVAAIGISTLVATLARTVEQAGGLNAIVALCMAAVGGVFIPLSQAPEVLARVSLLTPHAWFLRAIDNLSVAGVGLADVLPSIVVLIAMGLITGAIGLARARRTLSPA